MLIKIAQNGDLKDQYILGFYYADSNDKEKNKKAGEWFQKAAEQGHVSSQVNVGEGYLYGMYSIEKNYNKAKEIFGKLADQKYIMGSYYLAQCYQHGYGVAKDEKKAIELYEVAANNGHVASAMLLTKVYLFGVENVISSDGEKTLEYYNVVCSDKRSMACITLNSEIMGDCMAKHNNNADFVGEDSNIDPLCKAMVTKVMSRDR